MRDTHVKTATIAHAAGRHMPTRVLKDAALARSEAMLTLPACADLVRLTWRLCLALDEDFIAEWHHLCESIGDDPSCDRIAEEECILAQYLSELGA